MANVAIQDPAPDSAEADLGTLLGLYHGYDQARVVLARLACDLGSEAASDHETAGRIWSRVQREGLAADLFHPPLTGATPGVTRGAHAAALAAFATVSEKAEQLLRTIHSQWPELRESVGGPLPEPREWD
jgi:hypothetical protein